MLAALLASGLTEAYFAYQDNKSALTKIQLEKASSAAALIKQFIDGVHNQIVDVARAPSVHGNAALTERRLDYLRLLQREGSVSTVRYIDSDGREQLRISRYTLDHQGPGRDYSAAPLFVVARSKGTYYGRIYFLRGSRPHMTISVKEIAPGRGVVAAEVDLQFIESVIAQAQRIGKVRVRGGFDGTTHRPSQHQSGPRTDQPLEPAAGARCTHGLAEDPLECGGDRAGTGKLVLSAFQTVIHPAGACSSKSR